MEKKQLDFGGNPDNFTLGLGLGVGLGLGTGTAIFPMRITRCLFNIVTMLRHHQH